MKTNPNHVSISRPDRNRRRLSFLTMAAAPVLALLARPPLEAFGQTTYTWMGGNGNWSTSTNWNPNGVPGTVNGDTALIDTNGASPVSVTYDYSGPASTLSDVTVDYTGSATGGGNTLSISSNLSLNVEIEYFGEVGAGTADQGNGSNTVQNSVALGVFTGSSGTYVLSGGYLTDVAGVEAIGEEGNGTFNQTGGTNTEDLYNIYLGYEQGANGAYTLSNGNLIDNGGDYPLAIGFQGNGTFIQSGGTNALNCYVTLGWFAGSNGTYTLSNGNLTDNSTDPLEVGFGGNGTFIQSGGTSHSPASLWSVGSKVQTAPLAFPMALSRPLQNMGRSSAISEMGPSPNPAALSAWLPILTWVPTPPQSATTALARALPRWEITSTLAEREPAALV